MNAAQHLAKMLRGGEQHLVADLEAPLTLELAQSGAAGDASDQAREVLDEMCQLFNISLNDRADTLDRDIPEAMWLGRQLKQAFDADNSSPA